MQIINPATEAIITNLTVDSPERVQEKYALVKKGQPEWAQKTVAERVEIIRAFHALLASEKDTLAKTLTAEVGKPLGQSKGEINGAQHRINFFLQQSEKYLQEELVTDEERMHEKIVYEALGVIANISAWNYPYLVGVNVFIPALIAGNAVLYKPSEYATLTGQKIGELMHQAGVPDNVFQVVIGGKEAGEALLDLPLNGYYFTGSYKTGQYIYERVAKKMVPCQMELGGKDPMYVSADNADIAKIAASAVEGAFYNNGQSCCAVERVYVHEAVYDAFLQAFLQEAKIQLKMGDPTEEGTFIGPLTRPQQMAVLDAQVKDAVEKGATLHLGGKQAERKGYYYEPTVLSNVNHEMDVMKEESFGPIIGIQKVANDAEAVQMMLDTDYGLAASVFSDSYETAEPILKQLDSGTVYWNCCDRVSPFVPWSGRKHSGIGATLSHAGIRAFTRPKAYQLRGIL